MASSSTSASQREAVLLGSRAMVGLAARSLSELSADVSLAQYRVLVLLDGRGPQSMRQLSSSLDVNPSTVSRVCDVLVAKRLIARRADAEDRRAVFAVLTARGRRMVAGVMERRTRLIDEVLAGMTPAARRRLAASMSDFAAAAGELASEAWTLGWPIDMEQPADMVDADLLRPGTRTR